ncbi:HipA family kinase [Cupriavidus campinensis]|uniref:HipA-like C-terminal domain-containing protein n=1 Tax=Cupriavidus campinensis TaxID=151783 RepID=A0ABY3EK24_9BURK|nr:HipA family kinase [Cupriavidus campinensis]TSP11294.1 hypothetical protein FGG12_18900 [Cupriavidus campinensis]
MIPILPDSAWREFRSAPANRGQNHTIHQALIVDHAGQEHKCFVKAAPQGNPMAFTEGLAWLVADALELPRPKFAALILLPVQKLRQCMPLDQHWMHYEHVLAFCSSAVPGKHITSRWNWLAAFRAARAFRHQDVARIAAFDAWVENQDRHTGNFLRNSAGDYIPIDNEFILYTLVWVASGINCAPNSLRAQAREMLKSAGYTKFEAAMVVASQQHEQAFLKVTPSLQQFITAMHADAAQGTAIAAAILQFLGQRAQSDWLANELGHIV